MTNVAFFKLIGMENDNADDFDGHRRFLKIANEILQPHGYEQVDRFGYDFIFMKA